MIKLTASVNTKISKRVRMCHLTEVTLSLMKYFYQKIEPESDRVFSL